MSALTPTPKETHLEIDLSALEGNYHFLKSKLQSETLFMGVVKAYAYGNHAGAIAKKLQEVGVNYLAVAYAQEGAILRDQGITLPILVLHTLPENFELIFQHCLEPALYSFKVLEAFIAFAESKKQTGYPVHLKFNTGLNRLGFQPSDIDRVVKTVSRSQSIKVKSVFSHLAASEDHSEKAFTQEQISKYKELTAALYQKLDYKPLRHLLNTSGILNYPEAQFDMVRSGIGLYGFGNDPAYADTLTPVATLRTVISQINLIEEGQTIGYNRAYQATKPMQTATLPLGHADGISRIYGNGKGWVVIHGKRAPIVGNVCMDMIMVDVTDIECSEGDEVIVFGKEQRADTLAENAGTISYELITALSQRVPRIIKE